MKMRCVIEAGRRTSPDMKRCLSDIHDGILSLIMEMSDSSASSIPDMKALERCRRRIMALAASAEEAAATWNSFDAVLGSYKYRFGTCARSAGGDLPGQMLLDFGDQPPVDE